MRTTAAALLAVFAAPAAAADPGTEFFEAKIRPALVEHCYSCHSKDRPKQGNQRGGPKGGLLLTTREGIRTGGDGGPAVVPGKPAESLLIRAIEYGGDVSPMPPKKKLPDAVIADFRKWVAMGAPDPRDGATPPPAGEQAWADAFRERAKWWSLQPVRKPAVPANPGRQPGGDPRNEIDHFILAKLAEKNLPPAPVADGPTLLRRTTYALTGLPPTPDELDGFLKDAALGTQHAALDRVVDRLLASPRFGEHWARHWMDVTRYAESHGSEGDPAIPEAWRYRDYLIRAFNADVPYDRMVREHVAGDLLPSPRLNPAERLNESAIGAAHLRMVEHGFQPVDSLDELAKTAENQIDVLSKAFLGLTAACARCHDHKFDAISQRDYHALFGVVTSSRPGQVTIDDPAALRVHSAELAALKARIRAAVAETWLKEADALPARLLNPPGPDPDRAAEADRLRAELKVAEAKLSALERAAREAVLKTRGGAAGAFPGPRPLAAWRFDGDAKDAVGGLHAERVGGATIRNGRLVLDGKGGHARSAPLKTAVREKTLEAWVSLATLSQKGSGVVSLETNDGAVFDALVFAERQPGKWIAGSDFFRRTRDVGGPAETAPNALVHLAATYSAGGAIRLFRNGEPYGEAYTPGPPVVFEAGAARVVIGVRHGRQGPLAGEVEEARLYDRPLTADEVKASFRAGPDLIPEAELVKALGPDRAAERDTLRKRAEGLRAKLAAAEAVTAADPWALALADAAKDAAHPLHPWAKLRGETGPAFAAGWAKLAARPTPPAVRLFADLTTPADYAKWFRHGVGLPDKPSAAGEFAVEPAGDRVLSGVYPAGVFTHLLSAKHNGVLTSPRFTLGKSLAVRVLGGGNGGVRVIPDNYPLGQNGTYPQARATRDEFGWVRFDTTYRAGSTAYLEFATADDLTRPAGPSAAGRSWFGVAQVVIDADPPKDDAALALLAGPAPASAKELAARYGATLRAAVAAWQGGTLTDPQAMFLDSFARRGLLTNSVAGLPAVAPLVAEYRHLEAEIPVPRRAPGVLEAAGHDAPLFLRGNHRTPGPAVPRGFLEALGGKPFDTAGTGRLELADALARPTNPLTARVMVNRLWHWLYGRGIVPTPDNFGKLGEAPTHPELLDYLAARFVEDGWSVKRMVRLMVTARAFRSASTPTAGAKAADPANVWLSHFRVRRLDAEAVRDGLLAAAGELAPAMFGPPAGGGPLNDGRRSVYLPVKRNSPHPFLEVFDKPAPLSARGARDVTTLPAQSLALMNSPFAADLTRRWGEKLAARKGETAEARLRGVFVAALGRPPTADELAKLAGYFAASAADHGLAADAAGSDPRPWRDAVHAVVCLKEAIYVK